MAVIARRDFLAGLFAGAWAAGATPARKPNIIFVCTDDQAAWALGCAGNADAKTPNIDRLRREGAYFQNCFVTAPVCSPSRASAFSGRYPTEVGITDVISPKLDPDLGLPDGTVIWPQVLSDAGYYTGLVGKWHLGTADRHHPTKAGFRYFAGFLNGGETSRDPEVEIDRKVRKVPGFTSTVLTDLAIDFVRRHQAEPFSLNLHFWAPHANTIERSPDGDRTWLPVDEEIWRRFRDLNPKIPNPDFPKLDVPRVRRMMKEYLASVATVDENLGRLFGVLDELKLTDNTIFIFTSDNGFNIGHHGIWHKGNGWWILTDNRDGNRTNLYDNSIRVPCVIRWPGVATAGKTISETVCSVDWYPTILAMAGVALPKQVQLRGHDFTPLLRGQNPSWNNDLYSLYTTRRYGKADLRMYRTPQWKLIRDFYNQGKDELYDLARDPGETSNLIDAPGEAARQAKRDLHSKLLAMMRQLGDPLADAG